MPPGSAPLLALALLLLTGCAGADDDRGSTRGVSVRMSCVNHVMGTNIAPPQVVVLADRSFHQRFGHQFDGWYSGPTETVYLSSHRDSSLLPHELAHHVQHKQGRWLNQAEARHVARLCG